MGKFVVVLQVKYDRHDSNALYMMETSVLSFNAAWLSIFSVTVIWRLHDLEACRSTAPGPTY
jgi:hypothetical protein